MLRRAVRSFCIILLCSLAASGINAKVIYVQAPPGFADTNDGLTWQTAKASVGGALSIAVAHDQIWVAKGYLTLSATLTVTKDVELYGGFVGNETALTQRPPFPRPIPDPNETVLGSSYATGVCMPSGADAATRLDGFSIYSFGGWTTNSKGGCISCVGSSPTIANNFLMGWPFSGYSYGGAIYCSGSSPIITGNIISRHSATYGGGICCDNNSCPVITNNTIMGSCGAKDIAITGSWGPGYGGGIYCDNSSSPVIANNIINGNSASFGGAIYCKNGSAPSIVNNTITGNYANSSGGALYCDGTSPTISNNIIAFNSSGIFSTAAGPTLHNNCVFNPDGADYTGLAAGTGDISLDPRLQAWQYGKVHIQPGSPCIDAGDNAAVQAGWTDMDKAARVAGAGVDIGADESDGTTWSSAPRIIYVKANGNDDNDGSSWAQAKQSLKWGGTAGWLGALDICSLSGGEIWVMTGTYESSVLPRPYVHMYGGFNGAETAKDQRNTYSLSTLTKPDSYQPAPLTGPGWHVNQIDRFNILSDLVCIFGAPLITNNGGLSLSAIYSAPVVSHNSFYFWIKPNSKGGAIYLDHSTGVISDNTIDRNTAQVGGGIYCYYSSPNITGNRITNNTANGNGSYGGGAIHLEYSSPKITGNTITGNRVSGTGGGAGISIALSSSPVISNNTIGGNTHGSSGGGIFSAGTCSPTISGNMIANNTSTAGGGVWAVAANGTVNLLSNTIYGNTASGSGGGLWLHNISSSAINLLAANNIVAFNSSGIYDSSTSSDPLLSNNCVLNPSGANYTNVAPGTGDISVDPMFVDRANSDYHIKLLSPCVNRGTSAGLTLPETDIDGQARIQYGAVDIGADECSLRASTILQSKLAATNVPVDLTGAIVSASFPSHFYVESDIRDCAIMVYKPNHTVGQGARADISGTLKMASSGERYIDATSTVANGSGSVAPLAMNNRVLGGGKTGFQDAVCRYSPAQGVSRIWGPMKGLSNIGLLVTIYGKVTMGGYGYIYVDDGSHVEDRSGNIGIYVSKESSSPYSWPAIGSFVSVTGISSCDIYQGSIVNTLLTRSLDDIIIIRGPQGSQPASQESPRMHPKDWIWP